MGFQKSASVEVAICLLYMKLGKIESQVLSILTLGQVAVSGGK